jgi:SAM-dependent methyltransferase
MVPGDSTFYAWIARKPGYYPESRWEWGEVTNEIKKRDERPASLLEVGCGSGSFLESVLGEPAIRAVGLDTEPSSIAKCREKGCEAYCEEISAFVIKNPKRLFDFVVAFHCLEHVSQPKEFLRAMLGALKPGGSIFVSTPYSPMSFETGWFDPLNHPPHHMTRWNARMYQETAAQLGLDVRFRMPKALSVLRRTKNALILRKFGPGMAPSRLQVLWALFGNLKAFLSEFLKQRARERYGGSCTADVVLAEFRKPTA